MGLAMECAQRSRGHNRSSWLPSTQARCGIHRTKRVEITVCFFLFLVVSVFIFLSGIVFLNSRQSSSFSFWAEPVSSFLFRFVFLFLFFLAEIVFHFLGGTFLCLSLAARLSLSSGSSFSFSPARPSLSRLLVFLVLACSSFSFSPARLPLSEAGAVVTFLFGSSFSSLC
jgi:hypothetical protein